MNPLEIVFVNASPDADISAAYQAECAKYSLVRCINAPQETLNLSKSLNIGIRATSPLADYVMTTGIEMLFSTGLVYRLSQIMNLRVIGSAPRGDLPIGYDIGDIETLHDRWFDIVDSVGYPNYTYSPGTIICIDRDWWLTVRGYDEINTPYNYNDSDLLSRAAASGLEPAIVPWEVAQILHIGHERSKEYYSITSRCPDGLDKTIVRNDENWGTYASG